MPDSSHVLDFVSAARAHDALPALERSLLAVMAVLGVPRSRTALTSLVERAGVLAPAGGREATARLKSALTRLESRGLIVAERDGRLRASDLVIEHAVWCASANGSFPALAETIRASDWSGLRTDSYVESWADGLRRVRWALHRRGSPVGRQAGGVLPSERASGVSAHGSSDDTTDAPFAGVRAALTACRRLDPERFDCESPLVRVCTRPVIPAFLATLPDELAENALLGAVDEARTSATPIDAVLAELAARCADPVSPPAAETRRLFLEDLLLREGLGAVDVALAREAEDSFWGVRGWAAFLVGDTQAALRHYETGLQAIRKARRRQRAFYSTPAGLFYTLALVETRDPARLAEAGALAVLANEATRGELAAAHRMSARLVARLAGGGAARDDFEPRPPPQRRLPDVLTELLRILCVFWLDVDAARAALPATEAFCKRAAATGYLWIAAEVAAVIARLDRDASGLADCGLTGSGPRPSADRTTPPARRPTDDPRGEAQPWARLQGSGGRLADLVSRVEPWERMLEALAGLAVAAPAAPKASQEHGSRLVWHLSGKPGWTFTPKEQRRTAKGWTSGRPVALKRLREEVGSFDFLSAHDLRLCAQIQVDMESQYFGHYAHASYSLRGPAAVAAAVGHPLVFRPEEPTRPVVIGKGVVQLTEVREGKNIRLGLTPAIGEAAEIVVVEDGPERVTVFTPTPIQRKLAAILKAGAPIPAAAKGRLAKVLTGLSEFVEVVAL